MPTEDVSDLRDVVDAINKLCETMKASHYDDEIYEDCSVEPITYLCEAELVSAEEVTVQIIETHRAEVWSDCQIASVRADDVETLTSDTEQAFAQCEPISEMYYTASSEVPLISDLDLPERVEEETEDKDGRKECVVAGHVAAMRERFESMTRTNTPCPPELHGTSPSLDVFRNITPSPDRLG